jgi:hypothetical protein
MKKKSIHIPHKMIYGENDEQKERRIGENMDI